MPRPTKKEQECPECERPRARLYKRRKNRQHPFAWFCVKCGLITEDPSDDKAPLMQYKRVYPF